MMQGVDDPMDLEMQLLPSPHEADNNDDGGSGAKQMIHAAILVVQSVQIFLEGFSKGSPQVSRVCSSKSSDSSPELDEESSFEDNNIVAFEFVDGDQAVPVDNTLHSKKQIRKLGNVLYSILAFKAHATSVAEGKPEVVEASDSLAASSEHHITVTQPAHSQIENLSKIVRQKNLRTLQQFGGLGVVKDALGTDLDKGISEEEALHRQHELSLCLAPTRPFIHLVWKEVKKKTVLLVFLAVALSIVFEIDKEGLQDGWSDGVVVLVAIVLQVLFASIHKYRKERRARKRLQKQQLKEKSVRELHVIRGGETKDVSELELVYGDLLLLKKGCQLPADGLFVDGEDLELDYGSEPYIINEQNPFLSYGERVKKGDARMVITSTYMMMSKAKCDANTWFSFEANLGKLNTCMHYIRVVISFLIIIVLFLRYIAGKTDDDIAYRPESMAEPSGIRSFSNTFQKIIKESKYTTKGLMKLLSVLLVGLTEGIPFVVSLAIVYWNDETLSDKATEQDSHVILKMAPVTKICTDTFGEFDEEATKAEAKACKESGIDIIIVSSKKLQVVKDLALQYGLTTDDDPKNLVVTGEDFRKCTDEERLEMVDNIRVLGEAFSSDKLLLVETLRKKGEVVVFLGQRTNEAPALLGADIGIAMGRRTSEKTRESSDIIVWDGSLSEIISMVDSGKCIYYNIQCFLQPVLITTISSIMINFIQTAAWGDASLTIVQSIYVNLSVLFLGGFALLTKASADKPITCGRSLITAHMTRNIILQVSYQVTCLVIIQTKGSGVVGSSYMKTVVSNIFIICQFFNLFNARELQKKNYFRGILRHLKFWGAITVFIVLHVTFVTVQDIFGYGPTLNWKLWAGCVLVGVMSWLVDWLGKCISWFIKEFVNRFVAHYISC